MFQSQSTDSVAIDRSVSGHMSITSVAVGEDFTLALADTGKVYSWGSGRRGQLGHGDFQSISFPRCIQFMKWKTQQICCGSAHSSVIGFNGALYTWGMKSCIGGVVAKSDFTNAAGDVSMPSALYVMGRRQGSNHITQVKRAGLTDVQVKR